MLSLSGKSLLEYIQSEEQKIEKRLGMFPKERDFVSFVKSYISAPERTESAIGISGLRGMGKTFGIFQAIKPFCEEALYICAEKGDGKYAADYISMIGKSSCRIIVLDEFSWIRPCEDDRNKSINENAEKQFVSFLQSSIRRDGKRIIITGTESFTIEKLRVFGDFIHRIDICHINLFSYAEYLRLFSLEDSKATMEKYLQKGGVFDSYISDNFDGTTGYINTAIVDTLSEYIQKSSNVPKEQIRSAVYNVIYKAVCPSNIIRAEIASRYGMPIENFLSLVGVDPGVVYDSSVFDRVSRLMCSIGFVVRIDNYDRESSEKYRTYIVNPAITSQFTKIIYGLDDLPADYLGHVFEAVSASFIYYNKLQTDDMFFYTDDTAEKNEIDFLIRSQKNTWLFETKLINVPDLPKATSLLSEAVNDKFNPDGRYLLYTGKRYFFGKKIENPDK